MQINGVGFTQQRVNNKRRTSKDINFGKRLSPQQLKVYPKVIKEGLDILGIKNLAIIMHGSCFPSVGRDVGIGSPIGRGAKKILEHIHRDGFNSVQLGPVGLLRTKEHPSPYKGTTFSKNPLFIDLKSLTEDSYGKILSDDTFNMVTKKAETSKDVATSMSDFEMAFESSDIALREAFGNFKKSGTKATSDMKKDFDSYKENTDFLHNDALYEALSFVNKDTDYVKWLDVDKNMNKYISDENNPKHSRAVQRKAMVEEKFSDEIEFYKFKQFLVNKQEKQNAAFRKTLTSPGEANSRDAEFKYIADDVINFDKRTVWGNQDAFAEGWSIGSVDGGPGGGPQTWDYPLLDPKKLFTEDGGLGTSGKLLKKKYDHIFESNQNVRIDHALGLFDPFIYKNDTVVRESLEHPVDGNKLVGGHVSYMKDVDPDGNYKKIYDKILLPTLKEKGINPKELVWEDFSGPNGGYTDTFREIYHGKHHLPGLTKTLWNRSQGSNPDNWAFVNCHDDKALTYASWGKENDPNWSPGYLGGYLMPDKKYINEKHPILGYSRAEHQDLLGKSNFEKAKDKLTALFVGAKNIQIHFTEAFGINETYNVAGKEHPKNWKLRVNNDFDDVYHKNLELDRPDYKGNDKYEHITLNMPETIMRAIVAKDMMQVANTADAQKAATRIKLETEHNGILTKLKEFANTLKEPSD